MFKNKTTKTIELIKTNVKHLFNSADAIDLLICLLFVLILFIPTLNRPWLIYDERIIYDSLYTPIPKSFENFFEILTNFGTNFYTISSNSLYSSIYLIRSCPLGSTLLMFFELIFKNNRILFHVLNLLLHISNTVLVFYILKVSIKSLVIARTLKRFLPLILTIIWAIHPVMIESVLLSTNFGASISYIFFFGFILDFLINRKSNSLLRKLIIPVIYLIPMSTNEYIVTLPFVLFIFSFTETYKVHSLKKAFWLSLDETKSYFAGLLIYIVLFTLSSNNKIVYPLAENQLIVLIERVFWLAPQIFVHFLKLIIYPKILSTDQTLFVHLDKTLFSPYSSLCILIFFCWLFIPLYLFKRDKRTSDIFLISWGFFFSLLPFLHILAPSYLLAAERYLYCPLALIMIGLLKIASGLSNKKITIASSVILILISFLCFGRSYYRTLDWKDNYSFLISTYKSTNNALLKAIKLNMIENTLKIGYSEDIISLLKEAQLENKKLKKKYQTSVPALLKTYGLDYDSILAKTASMEAIVRCLYLKEDYHIGINLLSPYINRVELLDPRITEIYASWLVADNEIAKARDLLSRSNSVYPYISPTLIQLFDLTIKYENNPKEAEKHLAEALKYNLQDPSLLTRAFVFYKREKNYFLAGKYSLLYAVLTGSKTGYEKALSNFLEAGYLRGAKAIVPKLLKISPDNPEALFTISNYYYKTNDYKNALSYLSKAYSIGSKDKILMFDIGYTLAKLYVSMGMKEQADNIAKEIFIFADGSNNSLIKLAKLYKSLDLNENLNICLQKLKIPGN